MSLRDLFTSYYHIHPEETITLDHRNGFLANGLFYFTTKVVNVETIHMEQIVLAYYLLENGYPYIALPIQNQQEEWFTNYYDDRYMIYQVRERNIGNESIGELLAKFHQVGSVYQYEPTSISSYGKWKKLWIEKITLFEEEMQRRLKIDGRPESQILFNVFPYIIGMTENAIQYLRETEEEEMRYFDSDQGTISFLRFDDSSHREVLWPDQLYYDHPARDIAEYLRKLFLTEMSDQFVLEFLHDYQRIRQLSVFSWRLIYARLLFPVHLFDAVQQCFNNDEGMESYIHLEQLVKQQENFEKRLRDFYKNVGVDRDALQLAEIDWL